MPKKQIFKYKKRYKIRIKNINKDFNFNEIKVLGKYLDDQKRILPRKVTDLSIKSQRKLTKAVKQARILGILPFVIQAEY